MPTDPAITPALAARIYTVLVETCGAAVGGTEADLAAECRRQAGERGVGAE